MVYNDLIEMTNQLEREGKELIAITDTYILVYWWVDKSYVSWQYMWSQHLGRYTFEYGQYLPIGNGVSKNEAIKQFSERINK